MLKERFKEFARDTENIGQERVASANEICDALIASEHSDAAIIAEWKDSVNDAWADLLELIDTRTELLQSSWELQKFLYDCKDSLERIAVRIEAIVISLCLRKLNYIDDKRLGNRKLFNIDFFKILLDLVPCVDWYWSFFVVVIIKIIMMCNLFCQFIFNDYLQSENIMWKHFTCH